MFITRFHVTVGQKPPAQCRNIRWALFETGRSAMRFRPLPYVAHVGTLDHWQYSELHNRTYVTRVVAVGVIYFSTARLGLSLDAVSGVAAVVWPPTGIALVALLLGGYRLWPGIALGAFLVNVSADAPVLVACG